MSDVITVTGNIATEPDLKQTSAGAVTSFRLACTQRRFDRSTNAWVDGATNWYTVSMFRGLADHAYKSLQKGHRVLLTGRLRLREWDNGTKKGLTAEIEADAIGHDLRWGTTAYEKSRTSGEGGAADAARTDDWAVPGGDGPDGLSENAPEHWTDADERSAAQEPLPTPF
ncbi:single-stranded DNA-binding protein [Microbacterium sp. 1P10UB]|uniref:single-stranded DNA-binding protein n=1 Tax=unclassified Microbacterium TaxID=2609290 RepID=UPI0039A2C7A0